MIEKIKKDLVYKLKQGTIGLLNRKTTFEQLAHDIVEDFISESIGINEQLRNENLALQNTIEQYREVIKKFNKNIEEIN